MRRQLTQQPDGSYRRELVIENHEVDCVKETMIPHLFWASTGRDDWNEAYREHMVKTTPLRLVQTPMAETYDPPTNSVLNGAPGRYGFANDE